MSDLRLVALAGLVAVALSFLAGVRLAFERPRGRHRYRASRVSALVFLAEAVAIASAPVPAPRALTALAVFAAALALFAWAARTNQGRKLGLAFGAAEPDHLQTAGPYRFVRHPFYASYVLAFVGGALAAGSAWVVAPMLVGAMTYWRAAREEEAAFAASPLRERYRRYARRVGMFLPRPPLPG